MMRNWPFWVGCLAIAAVALLYFWPAYQDIPLPPPGTVPPPAVVPVPTPEVEHPIAEVRPGPEAGEDLPLDRPLPDLDQSDSRMAEILAALFKEQQLDRFFLLDHFIERFVVMVDSLPRPQWPATHRPIKKIPGQFEATGEGAELALDPANYQRYTPFIDLVEGVDPSRVIAVYVRLYPLFQKAYEKLGYPDRYFNDRLVEVLDHLLAAPTVTRPVRLVRPKYYYQFADPELEGLSAGQKAMIRIGPDNAARVKELLRDYRQRLAGSVIQG